ncbi:MULTISPECIES: type VI secretion system Vgr family protein [Dyella]|nr:MULTISPECIES: type VI secretion system tip protein TssI/VgrG [Dyella]
MSPEGRFAFTFTSEGVPDAFFQVMAFRLEEGLSESFVLQLELVSADTGVEFSRILDQSALFTIWVADEPQRYVHGVVSRFEQNSHEATHARYRAVVEPVLAKLSRTSAWRIHQGQSLPQIAASILQRHRLTRFEQSLVGHYPPRDYCVQAGESDRAFFERLSAECGLYYAFAHASDGHTLVQGDDLYIHGLVAGETVPFHARHPEPGGEPGLWSLRYAEYRDAQGPQVAPADDGSPIAHWASSPDAAGSAAPDATPAYPSGAKNEVSAAVEGNDARLQPGLAFDLVNHPRADWNRGWRVVRMVHRGVQRPAEGAMGADARLRTDYRYTAHVIPDRATWRPPLIEKPRVSGPHLATVVGPANKPIHCDELGRVKVRFAWDHDGARDGESSCWIRVAQGWAGAGMGQMAVPRVGQEVIVSYLQGDCDQPVIIGSTFTPSQMPPQDLPLEPSRITLRSRSLGGDVINELSFEDAAGKEEMLLRAGRDLRSRVDHDQDSFVGHDRQDAVEHDDTTIVGHDARRHVGHDERVSVAQDRHEQIGRDATSRVERNEHVIVGHDKTESIGHHRRDSIAANQSVSVGGNAWKVVQGRQRLDAMQGIERKTAHYQLDARERIEIRAPGGSIVIDERGITIDGSLIRINTRTKAPVGNGTSSNDMVGPAHNADAMHNEDTTNP